MGDVRDGHGLGILGGRQGLRVLGLPYLTLLVSKFRRSRKKIKQNPHRHGEQVRGAGGWDAGRAGCAGRGAPPPSRHLWPLIGRGGSRDLNTSL